jgi:hypothetical protein
MAFLGWLVPGLLPLVRGTVPRGVRWRGYDWRLASYASVGSGVHDGALGVRVREGGVGFLQSLAGGAERDRGGWWLDTDWGCKVAEVVRGERKRSRQDCLGLPSFSCVQPQKTKRIRGIGVEWRWPG